MGERMSGGRGVHTGLVRGLAAVMLAALGACGGGGGSGGSASSAQQAPQPPVAQIALIQPEAPSTQADVVFEAGSPDGANTYEWQFGDGSAAAGRKAVHRYAVPGSYAVRLVVSSPQGLRSTASATVVVTPIPVSAAIGALSVPKPRIGDDVEVVGAGTGQAPLRFRWEDNGRPLGESEQGRLVLRFSSSGQHVLSLTVVDATGRTATANTSVSVGATLPSASILSSPSRGIIGTPAFFQAREDASVTRYGWNFGDGSPDAAGPAVSHTYAAPGRYAVTLSAWNADGEVATAAMTLDVHHPPPSVQIETRFPVPAIIAAGQTQVFSARAKGAQPMQYRWRFSDGATASAPDAQHVFNQPGLQEVSLEVTDSHGEKANASLTLKVGAARFEWMPGTDRMLKLQAGQGPQSLAATKAVPILCQDDGSVLFLDGAVYKIDAQRRVTPFAGRIDAAVPSLEPNRFSEVRFVGKPAFIVRTPDAVPYVQDLESLWRLNGPVATRMPLDFRMSRMDAVDRQGRVWHRNPLSSDKMGEVWRYEPASGKRQLMLTSPVTPEGDAGPALPSFMQVGHMTFSPQGDLYFVEQFSGLSAIRRMTPEGRLLAVGTVVGTPMSDYGWSSILDVDASGTAYLLDQGPRLHVLRDGADRVIPIGSGTASAQISACPHPSGRSRQVALSLDEGEFMLDVDTGMLTKLRGRASDFANPTGPYQLIGADAKGQVYAVSGSALGRLDAQGRFQAWVGDSVARGDADGTGPSARFAALWKGAITSQGEAWVADYSASIGPRLRHVDSAGQVRSFPLGDSSVHVLTTNAAGDAVLVGETALQIVARDGSRTQGPLPGGYRIEHAVMNRDGTLYFKYGCALYQQPPTGPFTLLAGLPGGDFGDCRLTGFAPVDGTGREAAFGPITAMTIDGQGTVYVADGESLRSISPTGQVLSLASVFLRLPDENGAPLVEAGIRPWVMVPLPSGEMLIQSEDFLLKSSGLGLKPAP